ncbi:MAG: replication restart helicase PriA [Blautia sp.]|jgi:primosomal protein N' (replication factor Y)
MFADIVVDISHEKLDRSFQYKVPAKLEAQIRPGAVVEVPFGRGNRTIQGYVVGLSEEAKFPLERMKEVREICAGEETSESRLIALAAWMRRQYGSTMIQALKTVFPVKEKVKAVEKKSLHLMLSQEEWEKAVAETRRKNYKARLRLLEALGRQPVMDYQDAAAAYGITWAVVHPLEERGWIKVESRSVFRNPVDLEETMEAAAVLSEEQRQAVEGITDGWQSGDHRPCLIRGVTGSGKTEVYMELIAGVLREGRQVIVLIPEIALTHQTLQRFYRRFGNQVSVLNSRLSQGERYDQFCRARSGDVSIMIGPRSALFTPFSQLGLIIIDEEHEGTYKSENSPRYHARETAIERARLEHAHVVMGSATPSVEAYYRCMAKEYRLFLLASRFEERSLPKVQVVDMREEMKQGNRSILSRGLWKAMEQRLEKKEQIMLFLNRRGYAGFVSCRSCGHVMKCPHCEVSLSEHNYGKLVCHYCGYEEQKPAVCPECGSPYIGGFKAGTQQIEAVVKKQFPKARVLRMDADTTKNKEGHRRILETFENQEADILIGTQMIVKGHDFPNVTLVGAIAADLSLNVADFGSAERTFQLLAQAVGRAGRGKKEGEAYIQTYHPEHYSIQDAAKQDYEAFYEEEIAYRRLLSYPPAAHMMAVLGTAPEEALLQTAMEYLKKYIVRIYKEKDLGVIGPADQGVSKINDIYRKVIYLKQKDYDILVYIKDKLEQYIEMNSGFRNIQIQFDFY